MLFDCRSNTRLRKNVPQTLFVLTSAKKKEKLISSRCEWALIRKVRITRCDCLSYDITIKANCSSPTIWIDLRDGRNRLSSVDKLSLRRLIRDVFDSVESVP